MVDSAKVERLEKQIRALRGSVVRVTGPMADRVAHLLVETRRLKHEAVGTEHESSLRSIENLLSCIERGLTESVGPLRHPSSHSIAAA